MGIRRASHFGRLFFLYLPYSYQKRRHRDHLCWCNSGADISFGYHALSPRWRMRRFGTFGDLLEKNQY
jgi:hypothetical protein